MSLSKWLPCDFEQCHPLLWGGGILVDHWSTISSFCWLMYHSWKYWSCDPTISKVPCEQLLDYCVFWRFQMKIDGTFLLIKNTRFTFKNIKPQFDHHTGGKSFIHGPKDWPFMLIHIMKKLLIVQFFIHGKTQDYVLSSIIIHGTWKTWVITEIDPDVWMTSTFPLFSYPMAHAQNLRMPWYWWMHALHIGNRGLPFKVAGDGWHARAYRWNKSWSAALVWSLSSLESPGVAVLASV